MKREIMKYIQGMKQDNTPWYAIVLADALVKGKLIKEECVFVSEKIWKKLQEEGWKEIEV